PRWPGIQTCHRCRCGRSAPAGSAGSGRRHALRHPPSACRRRSRTARSPGVERTGRVPGPASTTASREAPLRERLGGRAKTRHSASQRRRYGISAVKIVIFGTGAVGGHVAARLGAGAATAGIEVSAVTRGAQLAAIRERGITLWIGEERHHARINATDRPDSLGPQDVLFVALKSSVLPAAAPAMAPLIGPDTSVVFAMNGIPWWYLYRC